MQQTLSYPGSFPGGPRPRLVVGVGISVLVHAVLFALLRPPTAPPQQDPRRWFQPLTVRLLPPKPLPLPEPVKPKAEPVKPKSESKPIWEPRPAPARETARPPEPIRQSEPVRQPIEPATPPVADSTPAPITVFPAEPVAPAPPEGEPKFDREAALKSAKGIYDQVKPPVTNWAAEKLNKGKEWKETKFERFGKAVASAAREDCRTAHQAAGLLAPLMMLKDKKDGGCKF